MTTSYADMFSRKVTPQTSRIPGRSDQVENSAGGYVFGVDKWKQLRRWLILGADTATYYASRKALVLDNAQVVMSCLAEDGRKTVDAILDVSLSGAAPKQDPTIFALSLAASADDLATRQYALAVLPKITRTGTHLFQFVDYVRKQRGWGRGLKRAVRAWYADKPDEKLVYQLYKYQSRHGYSHRDLLRLTRPTPSSELRSQIYKWVCGGSEEVIENGKPVIHEPSGNTKRVHVSRPKGEAPEIIRPYLSALDVSSPLADVMPAVLDGRVPWESVASEKRTPEFWGAIYSKLPLTALIRNLANLTRYEVLTPASFDNLKLLKERLTDVDGLRKQRVHPIQILSAALTYTSGHGARDASVTWKPISKVVDALNDGYYASFGALSEIGARVLLALDVSGSMTMGQIAGVPGLSPRVAAAVIAMEIARKAERHAFIAFSSGIIDLPIAASDSIDTVVTKTSNLPFDSTDCSQPMLWAMKKKYDFDVFMIVTDNETYAGAVHPTQALKQYRQARGIQAKLVTIGVTATGFTIADHTDPDQLDVVGFDLQTPQIIRSFMGGFSGDKVKSKGTDFVVEPTED